ncbi:PEGA domain-containing protein, partial [bacterium]
RDEIFIEITPKLHSAKTGKTVWSEVESTKEYRYAGSFGNSRASLSKYITATISKTIRKAIDEAKPVLTSVSAGEGIVTEAKGKLSITSDPSRAKVYLNDVYYGLTPFASEVDAGIYELTLKSVGFKNSKEKLSIRKSEVTEIDVKFEKE